MWIFFNGESSDANKLIIINCLVLVTFGHIVADIEIFLIKKIKDLRFLFMFVSIWCEVGVGSLRTLQFVYY